MKEENKAQDSEFYFGGRVLHKDADALLRLPQVQSIFPISKTAWYEGIRTGKYPAGIKLSERTVAWRRSSIVQLINSLEARGM